MKEAARARLLLPLAALLGVGCSDEPAAGGELGNVTFSYVCSGESDYQCLDRQRGMPEYIGVGAEFGLAEDEVFASREQIRSASPALVEKGISSFTWKREGHAAILIFESFGEIEDFVHLTGLNLDSLRPQLEGGVDTSSVELLEGASLPVRVIPSARNGSLLGGSFGYAWQSEDENVVSVVLDGGSNRVLLHGTGIGSTRVTVAAEGVSASVAVSVRFNPNLPERLDGGHDLAPSAGDAQAQVEIGDASPERDASRADGGGPDDPLAGAAGRDAAAETAAARADAGDGAVVDAAAPPDDSSDGAAP